MAGNIQQAHEQGAQALQKLMADKSARDQMNEQQGVQQIDLLKNCVFSSLLPIKMDMLNILTGGTGNIWGSLNQNLSFYGINTTFSKRKPVNFFISIFGGVIDMDYFIEKLKHAQAEPDKYGQTYQSYQQALQNHKPVDFEAQQKYENFKQEQQQVAHRSGSASGGQQQDEMSKFSEGHRRAQQANHENHNHNNHYNAMQFWKMNEQVTREISHKHQNHLQSLAKQNRDNQEAFQKEMEMRRSKGRR